MDVQSLIAAVNGEIETLTQVRALLTGSSSRKPGRPGKATSFNFGAFAEPKKRHMSAEARERIAAAQRKRWAKQKRAAKKAAKKAPAASTA
jgi:hypothetical protein